MNCEHFAVAYLYLVDRLTKAHIICPVQLWIEGLEAEICHDAAIFVAGYWMHTFKSKLISLVVELIVGSNIYPQIE